MKPAELKPFKVGYGDEMIAFYPRMASDAELDEVNLRFAEISDSDDQKYQKLFDIRIEAIAEFSAKPPQKIVKEKGEVKYVDLVKDAESALDALRRYFGSRTPEAEKIVRAAYNGFVNQMTPEVDFL